MSGKDNEKSEAVEVKTEETNVDVKNRKSKIIIGGAVAGVVGFIITFVTLFVVDQNSSVESSDVSGGNAVSGKLFTLNNAQREAAEADALMFNPTNYVASDSLSKDSSSANVYKIVGTNVESGLASLASALGVEGDFYSKKYVYDENSPASYEVWWGFEENGYVDYRQPSITAYYTEDSDGAVYWNYSKGYDDVLEPFEGIEEPMLENGEILLEVDEEGNILNADELGVNEDELESIESQIIIGDDEFGASDVDSATIDEIRDNVVAILSNLGVESSEYELTVDSRWGVNVIAEMLIEGERTPLNYSFYFTPNGELESAYGALYETELVGEYDVISAYNAAGRANNYMWYGQAPQSEYTVYYEALEAPEVLDNIELREETISDTIENGLSNATETGSISELRPETFEETEAKGLIVKYVAGETPDSPDGGINGFAGVEGAEGFTLGRELGENMWLIEFPENKTVEETEALIEIVFESGVFETVAGDYIIGFIPTEPLEPSEVTLDSAKSVWVTISDAAGSTFLVKGYVLTSSDLNYAIVTVMGIPEELIDIREPDMIAYDELDSGMIQDGSAGVEEPMMVEGFNPDEEAMVDSEMVE